MVKCNLNGYIAWQSGSSFEFNHCDFFRLSRNGVYGTVKFTECVGDFKYQGIEKAFTESTFRLKVDGLCRVTNLFTEYRGEEIKYVMYTIHWVFIGR